MLGRRQKIVYGAGLLALAFLLAGCGGASERDSQSADSQRGTPSRELYRFDSLASMVATSDLVVVGTVRGVRDGRTVGESDSAIQFTEATVSVDDVLRGAPVGSTVVLEVNDAADADWLRAGERSVFFLQRKDDGAAATYYRPVNSQGVYRITAPGRLSPTGRDELSARVGSLSVSELRTEVEAAKRAIAAGRVRAETPSLQAARQGG